MIGRTRPSRNCVARVDRRKLPYSSYSLGQPSGPHRYSMDSARWLVNASKGIVIDQYKAGTFRFESRYVKLVQSTCWPRNLVRKRPKRMQEAARRHRIQILVPTPRVLVRVRFKCQQYPPALDVSRHHLASSSLL